jgi:hypothetical protein
MTTLASALMAGLVADATVTSDMAMRTARLALKSAQDAGVFGDAELAGAATLLDAAAAGAAAITNDDGDDDEIDPTTEVHRTVRRCLKYIEASGIMRGMGTSPPGAAAAQVVAAACTVAARGPATHDEASVALSFDLLATAYARSHAALGKAIDARAEELVRGMMSVLRFRGADDADLWSDGDEYVRRFLESDCDDLAGAAPAHVARRSALAFATVFCTVKAPKAGADGGSDKAAKKGNARKSKKAAKHMQASAKPKRSPGFAAVRAAIDEITASFRSGAVPEVHGSGSRRISAMPSDAEMFAVLFLYGAIGPALQKDTAGGKWIEAALKTDMLPVITATTAVTPVAGGSGARGNPFLAANALWAIGQISDLVPDTSAITIMRTLIDACITEDHEDGGDDAEDDDDDVVALMSSVSSLHPVRHTASSAIASMCLGKVTTGTIRPVLDGAVDKLSAKATVQ